MGPFTAAPHHDVLLLLIQIAVLLATARLFGEIALRFGQPSVVGEISAGIILGPSFLSALFPVVGEYLVPKGDQGYLLEVVSLIGAMFLLLITGLETDLQLIRRHIRTAAGVSIGGIVCTFASGFALGMYLPDKLLANSDQRIVFALFVATAMSISAIPVIAKVLMDMNLMRRDVGQTILAAGMNDDTVGWIILSIVAALASGQAVGEAEIGMALGKVLVFLLISFTIGQWIIRRALEYTQDKIKSRDRLITLVAVFTFIFGAFTQALGLEAVLGAFVVGIILSQMRRLPAEIPHFFESVALGVFAPIFFGVAGLKVNIQGLFDPELALYAVLVIVVACTGKVLGTYLGARLIGRKDHWTALSFGAGLNARGAMEIIIATIGLSLGILSQEMFSIIVVMAMVTSLMAPTALRFTLARVTPSSEELDRLKKEERAAESPWAGLHRVLVPVRIRTDGDESYHQLKSTICSMLAEKNDLSLTLMTIANDGESAQAQSFLDTLAPVFSQNAQVVKRVVSGTPPVEAILDEVKKDYQLLMLGATETEDNDSLFSPAIDDLVKLSSCSTLIFKPGTGELRGRFRDILVPTNGSAESLRAADLAFRLADENTQIHVVYVVVRDGESPLFDQRTDHLDTDLGRGHQHVAEMTGLAEVLDIPCSGEVRIYRDVAGGILNTAVRQHADLIILGSDVRPGGERLFLGAQVERVLNKSTCPVIVVNE